MSRELCGGFLRQAIRGILGMQRSAGRVAVVTGAADGIGRAVAVVVVVADFDQAGPKRGRSVKKSKPVHDVRYVEIHPWTKNPIPATISVVSMSRMNSRSGNQSRIFFPTNEPKIMIDPRARPITILSDVRIETRR